MEELVISASNSDRGREGVSLLMCNLDWRILLSSSSSCILDVVLACKVLISL